jgi:predicted ATPase
MVDAPPVPATASTLAVDITLPPGVEIEQIKARRHKLADNLNGHATNRDAHELALPAGEVHRMVDLLAAREAENARLVTRNEQLRAELAVAQTRNAELRDELDATLHATNDAITDLCGRLEAAHAEGYAGPTTGWL